MNSDKNTNINQEKKVEKGEIALSKKSGMG